MEQNGIKNMPDAEPDQGNPQDLSRGPRPRAGRPRGHKQHCAGHREHIHEKVKEAVGHDLEAQVGARRVGEAREKMMPLQDLMQDDAVEKPTEREAEQQPPCSDSPIERLGNRIHVRTTASRPGWAVA